jgi:hypothetical protein
MYPDNNSSSRPYIVVQIQEEWKEGIQKLIATHQIPSWYNLELEKRELEAQKAAIQGNKFFTNVDALLGKKTSNYPHEGERRGDDDEDEDDDEFDAELDFEEFKKPTTFAKKAAKKESRLRVIEEDDEDIMGPSTPRRRP